MNKLLVFILLIVIVSISLIGLVYEGDLYSLNLQHTLKSPSYQHPMGTDELGRDIFHRLMYGTSLSIRVSLLAWLAALIVGLIVGTFAGYYSNSIIDNIISSLIMFAYVTPFMLFLIALLGVIGPGLTHAYIILVLLAWAAPARQTRVVVKNLRNATFVTAAKSYGFNNRELFFYVIIPQVFRPALYASLAVLPEIIALDAALSFFGLGAQPPTPTLGKMIVDGLNYLTIAWWMSLFPIIILAFLCISVRIIAQSIRVD